MPQTTKDADIRRADQDYKEQYKDIYDRRHGVQPLSKLELGDHVLMKTDAEKNWENSGTIVAADPDNRTYLINSPAGVVRRNRKHLQQVPPPSLHQDSSHVDDSEDIPAEAAADPADSGSQQITPPTLPSVTTTPTYTPSNTTPIITHSYNTRASSGYTAKKPLRYT